MKKKTILLAALVAGVAVAVALLPKKAAPEQMEPEQTAQAQAAQETTLVSEEASSGIYTWEDYQNLSPEAKEAFFLEFESMEAFEAWLESVKPEEASSFSLVWDRPGKKPNEYTWEEYMDLSHEDQERFYQWFDTREAFEQWIASAKPEETIAAIKEWDKPGKKPDAYTWEEYQALNAQDRESFYHWFASSDAFERWAEAAKPAQVVSTVTKWNKPGKKPNEYTWEEYEALTGEDQEKFYQWFESAAAFEAWLKSAKPVESGVDLGSWNKSGKEPNEYTWEEYEALSQEDQERFYQWFGSREGFEAWMRSAIAQETAPAAIWDKSGKTPDEYTWEEYQRLSAEDQEKFYQWFGSVEAFEEWMDSVKPDETAAATVWDKPGKKPDEYTWEEYEALPPEEQDLFFEWFASVEAFEAWMRTAKGE